MRTIVIITLALGAGVAMAHGGGLDQYGCHHDRKNGGYHCHRAAVQSAPSSAPAKPIELPAITRSSLAEAPGQTATVTATSLLLRSRQSTNSPALMRLRQGAVVQVLDRRGHWWKVDPDGNGPFPNGFVAARYLQSDQADAVEASKPRRSDAEIAQELIAESMARYPGSCGCPYQTDRAGRRCGARSAYIRSGGYSLYCYVTDVPESAIRGRR